MTETYLARRMELLNERLAALTPNLDRAEHSVRRLEAEQVPAGATAQARAARLAAARAMAATLQERERQVRVAIAALQAELAG
jgi:chromosome segregation ATPase